MDLTSPFSNSLRSLQQFSTNPVNTNFPGRPPHSTESPRPTFAVRQISHPSPPTQPDTLLCQIIEQGSTLRGELSGQPIGEIWDLPDWLRKTPCAHLTLVGSGISGAGLQKLLEALEENGTPLKALKLSVGKIGKKSAAVLARIISKNNELTELDLANSAISNKERYLLQSALMEHDARNHTLSQERFRAFSQLVDGRVLTLLKAESFNAEDKDLMEWLRIAPIDDLVLTGKLNTTGMKILCGILSDPCRIVGLSLERCHIAESDFLLFAEALKANSTLTSLSLYGNKIGDTRVAVLAEALQYHSALHTLNLESNDIGNAGAASLAGMLKTNSSLKTLYLSTNKINDAGALPLQDALRLHNISLTSLLVHWNNVTTSNILAINQLTSRNRNYARYLALPSQGLPEGTIVPVDVMTIIGSMMLLHIGELLPQAAEEVKTRLAMLDLLNTEPPPNNSGL